MNEPSFQPSLSRLTRRQWLFAAGAAIATPSMIGCQSAPPKFRIGILNTFSGFNAEAGITQRQAAWLALQRQPDPRPSVEWIEYDDQDDPRTLAELATRIQRDQPDALLGPATSTMAVHWLAWATSLNILTLSATATAEDLSGQDDWFFRICSSTKSDATQAAQYIATHHPNLERICILRSDQNPVFSSSWERFFREQYKQLHPQHKIHTIIHDPQKSQPLHSLADSIEQLKPHLLILITPSLEAAYFAQQRFKRQWNTQLMVTDWVNPEILLQWGGQGSENAWIASDFDPNHSSHEYTDFRKSFITAYKREPTGNDVRGYDAANTLLTALRLRKSQEPIKSTLLRIKKFTGLQSHIEFNRYGDCQRPLIISSLQNGQLKRIDIMQHG